MTYLLDVNVLIALVDRAHIAHRAAHDWFDREGHEAWATCPITENGLIRIFSHGNYSNGPMSPPEIINVLAELTETPGHEFWPNDISLRDARWVNSSAIANARQITDTYLLALAVSRGGMLATFDRRLSSMPVRGGAERLRVIPN